MRQKVSKFLARVKLELTDFSRQIKWQFSNKMNFMNTKSTNEDYSGFDILNA